MSNSCSIRWIEQLLFGTSSSGVSSSPPPELKNIVLRMEAEHILWRDILLQGGLTAFPYQVHGDLNYLIDFLENRLRVPDAPVFKPLPFKTRAVTKFWTELQMLLSKQNEPPLPILPPASRQDDDILKSILEENHPGPHAFQSAAFWGETARKFIHLCRSVSVAATTAAWSVVFDDDRAERLQQLYETTCVSQGRSLDPFNLLLVHHSEYVNAAHWQTPDTLRAFMLDRPSHPLTVSVQTLLQQSVEDVLHGERPATLPNASCPTLDAFLHNVRVIDDSVEKGFHSHAPPKLVDVFQRLLALSYRDDLWEKNIPVLEPRNPTVGTSLFHLTQQLRIAEREKRVLLRQLTTQSDEESGSVPPPRTCPDYLYASNRPRQSVGERGGPAFPR